MLKVSAKVTKDDFDKIKQAFSFLTSIDVLVGVPQENSARPGKVTNAELAYIHTHGSPIRRIPARPIIEPAIEDKDNQSKIVRHLEKATNAALQGDKQKVLAELTLSGMVAQNIVRDWFTNPNNHWAPNSPITIARKKSDRPLIDTGELRKSMIYVIRKKGVK
ncbi:MAG: phage virion morphogenesis protein [Coriobacteriia bacterium]